MEIDINKEETILKIEAREIGESINQNQATQQKLQSEHQELIQRLLKNQGALDLLKKLSIDD